MLGKDTYQAIATPDSFPLPFNGYIYWCPDEHSESKKVKMGIS
jgi:hypothetical protein